MNDLRQLLESIDPTVTENARASQRLDLSVPAEITTSRGNVVAALTREVSRSGIGLFHRGAIQPGEVTVKVAADSRDFNYQVQIEWCQPCENGMFMSGGSFMGKPAD